MGNSNINYLAEELLEIQEKGLFRQFKTIQSHSGEWITLGGNKLLNLCSNNYLGLANDPRVKEAAAAALEVYGFGATASRLVVGNYELYDQLEKEIALFKGTEGALVFNSGYAANLGVIPVLVGREDIVISDKLNHASIVDGIILSRAEHRRYKHRDLVSLENILKNCGMYRRKLIITDTVFSMDGDLAPLKEIVQLKEQYGALLMVDEAHGGGVFGSSGRGLAEAAGVSEAIDINMGTLSKAFGGAGAYVAGSRVLIDYLRNKSRTLIYTTALPPAVIGGILAALRIIRDEPWRRERVLTKAAILRKALKEKGFNTLDSQSQIIPILIGPVQKTLEFSHRLYEENLLVSAIRPPTVPVNTARLRVTLMATVRDDDLEMALTKLVQVGRQLRII
ncbi:MAG: 8-amino-7-oxononanoate synthase [Firmicutes bacterium]|nr:8-amino-7-oxononanoate synthase [Bacillota bacterium]